MSVINQLKADVYDRMVALEQMQQQSKLLYQQIQDLNKRIQEETKKQENL